MSTTRTIEADVLVLGAGPAGAIAALHLAATHRVVMLERRAAPAIGVGDSLPQAARRLLGAMELWESFMRERHAPCHGNLAQWGSDTFVEADFLRDPDGPGWHLDLARFKIWLREAAKSRGAALLGPVVPRSVVRKRDRWCLRLDGTAHLELTARALIDASGRSSWLARHLGAHRLVDDRLVCGWTRLGASSMPLSAGGMSASASSASGASGGGVTHVIAEPEGWWYSAPLPGGLRMLAFHTDSDLEAARDAGDRCALLARARRVPAVAALLEASDLRHASALRERDAPGMAGARAISHALVAAHGGELSPPIGQGWLATGDAALSFDPLSSQGLLNSLFTGLAAAEATTRLLDGDANALPEYANTLSSIRRAYLDQTARWYGEEQRWPDRPFWSRRHRRTVAQSLIDVAS